VRPEKMPLLTNGDSALAKDFLSRGRTATVDELAARIGRPLEIITDRNLITEYKYGRPIGPQRHAEEDSPHPDSPVSRIH
jgi:hypothetical protein